MSEFLWLLLWIAAVMAVLKLAATNAPDHPLWTEIDKPYYALGLVGVVVAFLAQTPERTRTHWLSASLLDRARLEEVARAQPMFSGPSPLDTGVADGFYDLQDIVALARGCTTAGDTSGRCAAAPEEAMDIEASFAGLQAPPVRPSVAEAAVYGARYCTAVQSLARRLRSGLKPLSPGRQQAALELGRLDRARPSPGAEWSQAVMRIRGAGGEAEGTGPSQDADFAVAVFNSQQPCPVAASSLTGFDSIEARWAYDWATATAQVRSSSIAADEAQRAYEQRDTIPGQLEVNDFASWSWPFAVALALCLKLARAWYLPRRSESGS